MSTYLQSKQFVMRQVNVWPLVQIVLTTWFSLKMRTAQQGEHILGQYVPQHLREEWIPKLLRYFRLVLDKRNF